MVNDQSIRNEASARPTGGQQVRRGRLVTQISWLYVCAILATLIVLHVGGDRWWPATLLMFSPRWVFVFPLVLFLPIVIFVRRRALWPLGIGLAVTLGPLMGLCLPWRPLIKLSPAQQRIRTLSCNVHFNDLEAEASAS